MKKTIAFLIPFAVAGCFKGATPDAGGTMDMGPFVDPHMGGSIMIASCGYTVTTRDGASIPQVGSPMVGDMADPEMIHLGIVGDPKTSMVIQWRTADDTTLASTAQWGMGSATDQTTEGITFVYDTPNRANPVRIHQAHLCGLKAGTKYSYKVGGSDGNGKSGWSQVFQFATAPDLAANPQAQVTIAVIGDTRGGYDTWAATLKQAQMVGMPDLILFNGDGVTLGPIQTEWDTFFSNAQPVLATIPIVGAHGNHDVNSVNYYSQWALPGDQEDFSLDYGAAHITVANDTPLNMSDLTGKAPTFLEKDFTASDSAAWKIFMHHQPMWSSASGHGSNLMLQSTWGPIVDKHKIDLVFNGHDHDYERTKPMRGQTPGATPKDGTIYVVAGSAGAPLYTAGSQFFTQTSQTSFNMVIVKLQAGMLTMNAYSDSGTAIDSLTINK
jgi:hypothetical protein